jgi:putative ABC transport system ATP-binding protein
MDTADEVIRLEHVSRLYQMGDTVVHALDDVTLSIRRGEFIAVMGPSGSGKSTLLNVLGCLDTPTSGTYRLDGQSVEKLSEDELAQVRQKKISFVFQTFQLVSRMSAQRNVELPMIFAGVPASERVQRSRAALEAVGLAHRIDHRPDEMSGGERQRVAIARAIVMQPSILLADEPTGNLDSTAGEGIVQLLEKLNAEGLCIVLVTHDPNIGQRARRLVRMQDGRLETDESNAAGTSAAASNANESSEDGPQADGGGA